MTSESHRTKHAIEALAVKRAFPRFQVTINVRLRRDDPEGWLAEELTVTENLGQAGALVPTSLAVMRGDVFAFEEVGGPFRARVQVVDVMIGQDSVPRLNLQFLGEQASEGARELLRRAGVFTAAGQVTVQSEIPPHTSHMEAIEAAIKEAFRGAPGSWRIEVALATAFSPPWWLITIEGLDELCRMSFRPAEQNAQFIHDRVREVLRRRGLVD